MKLIALYKQPPEAQHFEDAYFKTHLPLLQRVPGPAKDGNHSLHAHFNG